MVKRLTETERELIQSCLGIDKNSHFATIYYADRTKSEIDKVYTMLFEAEGIVQNKAFRDNVFNNYFRGLDGNVGTSDGSVMSSLSASDFNNVLRSFREYQQGISHNISEYHTGSDKREFVCNVNFQHGKRGSLKTTLQMLDKLYQYGYIFDSSCGFHTHVSVNSLPAYSKFMTLSFKQYFLDWYDYFSTENNIQSVDNYKRIKGNEYFCRGTFNPLTENSNFGGSFLQTSKSYNYMGRYEFIQCGYNLASGSHSDFNGKRKTMEFRVFAPLKSVLMAKTRMRSLNKMLNAFLAYYKEIPANEIDTSEKAYKSKLPDFYYNGYDLGLREYQTMSPIKRRGITDSWGDFERNIDNDSLIDQLYATKKELFDNGFNPVGNIEKRLEDLN